MQIKREITTVLKLRTAVKTGLALLALFHKFCFCIAPKGLKLFQAFKFDFLKSVVVLSVLLVKSPELL